MEARLRPKSLHVNLLERKHSPTPWMRVEGQKIMPPIRIPPPSSQLKVIEPQLQYNINFQSTSLWPPWCAVVTQTLSFPTKSSGKANSGNAMFRWMSTITSKANAFATILRSTPEETDHLLQRLKNESELCQNPSITVEQCGAPKALIHLCKWGLRCSALSRQPVYVCCPSRT